MTEALSVVVESDGLPAGVTRVLSLSWRGELGLVDRGRVELEVDELDFDGTLLLGADASVTLRREGIGERRFAGLVSAVEELRAQPDGVVLALEIEPAMSMLALRRRSRIFQELSALDIAKQVLEAELGVYGRSLADETSGTYAVREYCVQYQESDLDFVSRLLEEEGVWFCFDHEGDTETLVLRDQNDGAPRIPGGSGGAVRYSRTQRELGDEEGLFAAQLTARATPTSVVSRHWDWTNVRANEGSDEDGDAVGLGGERYEHGHGSTLTLADFGGRYQGQDAQARAVAWREGVTGPRQRLEGASVVISMTAGQVMEVTDHPVVEANGEFLLVSVEHRLGQDEGGEQTYENVFVAQPMDRAFRPPRRVARPRIDSLQTAAVVGPSGEEIHPDEHERIKVQFHWDRDGASDEHSSCWIRSAQPWAGAGWGWLFTPRMGMEVIVRFEHGDPDRPIVTDSAYNGANTPPYALPDEKTKSTIKSDSSLGGGGFNEWRFEDAAGSEEVYWHAQRNLDEVVLRNHTTNVGGHQKNEVDKDQLQEITGNQTEKVKTTQELTVGGDRTVDVTNGFEEHVVGSETRTVSVSSEETIEGGETHTVVDSGLLEIITGGETRDVSGGMTETINGDHGLLVTGPVNETVSLSMSRTAANITLDGSASITMTGTAGITIDAPILSITSPSFLTLSVSETEEVVENKDSTAFSFDAYALVFDLVGLSISAGVLSFEAYKSSFEAVGFATGVYGLVIDVVGADHSNKHAARTDFFAVELVTKASLEKEN